MTQDCGFYGCALGQPPNTNNNSNNDSNKITGSIKCDDNTSTADRYTAKVKHDNDNDSHKATIRRIHTLIVVIAM